MAFTAIRRVDFPMLDKAGIMYYPNYWDMAHRFFEESWLEICGVCYPDILDEWKLGFPAVSNECKFLAPLRMVKISIARCGYLQSAILVLLGSILFLMVKSKFGEQQ